MGEHRATQAIAEAVEHITFGVASSYENLTVVPLLGGEERNAPYRTLDEALAGGWAEIGEISEAGQVSALKIVVTGDVPVLLLDGEELIGAKQNRVVNLTILAPAMRTTVIPVSCVESGRWHHVSREFASTPRAQFSEGRAAKIQQVTESLARSGTRASDQGEVWARIAEKSARLDAGSETSAMSVMFDKLGTSIDEFVAAFPPAPQQVGAMFFINGVAAGLELFDVAGTWRKLSPKLVRSYAIDAIDRRGRLRRESAPNAPATFAGAVSASAASVFPAIGEGDDVRLSGGDVSGAALVVDGRVIHLSAFPGGVA
jgi:hypothetical protein